MRMPSVVAASRMVVPSGTVIGLPSMVSSTCLPIALAWAMASTVRSIWLFGAPRGAGVQLVRRSVHVRLLGSFPLCGDSLPLGPAEDLVLEMGHDGQQGVGGRLPQPALAGQLERLAQAAKLLEIAIEHLPRLSIGRLRSVSARLRGRACTGRTIRR